MSRPPKKKPTKLKTLEGVPRRNGILGSRGRPVAPRGLSAFTGAAAGAAAQITRSRGRTRYFPQLSLGGGAARGGAAPEFTAFASPRPSPAPPGRGAHCSARARQQIYTRALAHATRIKVQLLRRRAALRCAASPGNITLVKQPHDATKDLLLQEVKPKEECRARTWQREEDFFY
ncbi:Protein of unknown function [Gryllus bimaculatus]|nr:Protein of unknown function [Gryllus bimaculatus]